METRVIVHFSERRSPSPGLFCAGDGKLFFDLHVTKVLGYPGHSI